MATNGSLLYVTVVSCNRLKDTEWISRQDPYVWVEYGSARSRTRTCTDGGKSPNFGEKFVFTPIEGLNELNVDVWNSNTVNHDRFIGSGRVLLANALSQGFDDRTWTLQEKNGRHAGEIRLIIEYNNYANKPASSQAQPYGAPQTSQYSAQPPYAPAGGYASAPHYPLYPPNFGAYPWSPYPPQGAYYAQPYPPNPTYPPQPYGSQYPQYPPGPPYPGTYPPY